MIKAVEKGLQSTKFYTVFLISVILAGIFSLSLAISLPMNNIIIRSSGIIATILPLHVEGRCIKDSFNNTITLRGVNQAGFLDDPNGWWNPEGGTIYSGVGVWNPDAVKYNLDGMKDWGSNVLRLPVTVEWWIENTSDYRQHIKDTITWAGERGIYVILIPWNVIGKGSQTSIPFPPYLTAEEELVIPSEQAFVDFWANVATELSAFPNVMFELFNEPHGTAAARDDWFRVTQLCIDAIRATDIDQIIIVQWNYGIWVNLSFPPPPPPTPTSPGRGATMDWVEIYPINDSLGNIVYSFHNYRGDFHRTIPTRVNVWEYDDIKAALQYAWVDYVLNTLNKPVLCGEIGANMWRTGEGLTQELAYFKNSLTIYNELNISYIAWVWTIPAHMQHGLLQNALWLPPPTAAGEILIASMRP